MFRAKIRKLLKPKLNHAGMTLVEIIIAITILSLVAIPVLRSITSAMYYNAKSRTRQSITLSAESLMETFKGYDLEQLQALFQNADAGDAAAQAALSATDADGFEYPADLNATELNFKVVGMKADDGKAICDVEIKATRQAAPIEVMEIDNILPTRDAIFRGDRDWDSQALSAAQADFVSNHQDDFLLELNAIDERGRLKTQNDIEMSCLTLFQRELTLTVSNDGTNDIVNASMTYTYYMRQHKYYEEVVTPGGGGGGAVPATTTDPVTYDEKTFNYPADVADYFTVSINLGSYASTPVFSNPVIGGEHPLQRLLIYYYPAYGVKDVINIRNNDGLAFDCYLIKQKASDLNNTQLHTKESAYTPDVNGLGTSGVVFYHNLDTNLGGSGSTPGASNITGFSGIRDYAGSTFIKQMALVYDLEMRVISNGMEVATFEGTMKEYMDYVP